MSKYFKLQEGWLTVGLLALLLFSVTLSIQQAQWSDGLTILTPVTIVGLGTGILMAKVRGVPRFLLDLLGLEIGFITVLVAVASVMHDPALSSIQDKVQDLIGRTGNWVNVAIRQDVSDDLVVFVLSLAVVTWVLAYSSAYFVFRSRQLWWALVPNGVALLINLSYSPVNLNGYIVVFMFSALLLMIRFNLLLKEERWQRERVNYSPTLSWAFLWTGSAVSVVLALAMWYVPASAANSTLNGMWEKVNQPWVDFQNTMSKLWSTVPGNQNIGGYASFNSKFTMGGSLNLSDAVALKVKSSERLYWRATTWDQFDGSGWSDTAADTFSNRSLSSFLSLDANQQLMSEDEARREVSYTVQIVSPKADVLFSPSRPVKLSVPSRLELSWRKLNQTYDIDTFYAASNAADIHAVPLELRALIGTLHQAAQEVQQPAPGSDSTTAIYATSKGDDIRQQIDDLDKRGIKASLAIEPAGSRSIHLIARGEVPVYDDITAVHSTDKNQRDVEYTAASMVSKATDEQLRLASTDYDTWVQDRYLKLPATVSQPLRELAAQVVRDAGATNPLDEARALEKHLRENYEYSTTLPNPPMGRDRLDWFLFDIKKGYCEYYAGSMVMMLRSLGVPARLAGGYAPGTYDDASQTYIIKESAAHAWPEVYFPGYGWIQFEPTPSQPVTSREVSQTPVSEPSPTADVTAGPTATLSLPKTNGADDPGQKPPAQTNSGSSGFLGIGTEGGNFTLLGIALVVALGVALVASRRRKSAPKASGVYYGRMISWARLLRLGPSAHQTPYEFSETLGRELPGTGLFARTIARAYVKDRYSPARLDAPDQLAVGRAWTSLRGRLWRSLPSRQLRRIGRRKRKQ